MSGQTFRTVRDAIDTYLKKYRADIIASAGGDDPTYDDRGNPSFPNETFSNMWSRWFGAPGKEGLKRANHVLDGCAGVSKATDMVSLLHILSRVNWYGSQRCSAFITDQLVTALPFEDPTRKGFIKDFTHYPACRGTFLNALTETVSKNQVEARRDFRKLLKTTVFDVASYRIGEFSAEVRRDAHP